MPLRTQGLFGGRMTVQNFMKIVWTVFEKFENFIERSEEEISLKGREKRNRMDSF